MTKKMIAFLATLAFGAALVGCQKEEAAVKEGETKVEQAVGAKEAQPAEAAKPAEENKEAAPATPAEPAKPAQ